jgi:ribonuclease H2 subunit A
MQWQGVELAVPDALRGKPLEMGIDEAGRGPVLGPMVYGSAFAELGYEWPKSVNDSKQLSPEERESTLEALKELPVGFGTRVLTAEEISAKMFATTPVNLNEMSHDAARMLVQAALDAGLRIARLFVDTVGPERKYQEKLSRFFPEIAITVSKKADSRYKAVGAASIGAKVLRDKLLRDFAFVEPGLPLSRDFGSGYPSDPSTVKWLQSEFDPVFGYPSIARFSWGSVETVFKKEKAVGEFESEMSPPKGSNFYAQRFLKEVDLGKIDGTD